MPSGEDSGSSSSGARGADLQDAQLVSESYMGGWRGSGDLHFFVQEKLEEHICDRTLSLCAQEQPLELPADLVNYSTGDVYELKPHKPA